MYEVRYINYLYATAMFSGEPILYWLFRVDRESVAIFKYLVICLAAGALPIPKVSQYSI